MWLKMSIFKKKRQIMIVAKRTKIRKSGKRKSKKETLHFLLFTIFVWLHVIGKGNQHIHLPDNHFGDNI